MNLDSSTHYSNFSTWGIKGTRTDEMYFVNNKSLKGVVIGHNFCPFAFRSHFKGKITAYLERYMAEWPQQEGVIFMSLALGSYFLLQKQLSIMFMLIRISNMFACLFKIP